MSLAIQWGYYDDPDNPPLTQGFIYFDAVTAYKRSFTGSVSKHPIDGGGLISDHFTRDNPVITLSAVISAVDISIKGTRISDLDGNTPINLRQFTDPVQIDTDNLVRFLPNVVGQFFTPKKPDVILASQPVDTLEQIQELLQSLFLENQVELVSLYEYENNNLRRAPKTNLVMTSLTFNEDPESGEGLFCDITIEQVSFVNTRATQVDQEVREALVTANLAKKAEGLETKGKQDSTVRNAEEAQSSILYGEASDLGGYLRSLGGGQ